MRIMSLALPMAALTILALPSALEAQRARPAAKPAPKAVPPKTIPKASSTMPVAPGFWIGEEENCGTVRGITFYDGRRWGNLRTEGREIYGSSGQPILRTAAGKGGYTNIWFDNGTRVDGDMSVRSLGPTRYMTRTISYGSGYIGGRVEVDEYVSKKCDYAQLPPVMRTAIQRYVPHMVAGAVKPVPGQPVPSKAAPITPAPVAALPAATGPLGIRPGHYINPNRPCNNDGGEIFFYDGRRWGWMDLSGYAAGRLDPVSGIRKAGNRWNLGYGEMLRVDGVDRIFIASDNIGNFPLRWCAPASVRANARVR